MVAEDNDEQRSKICATVKRISDEAEITEVSRLQSAFLILIKEQDFDTVIMSFELLGDDWRRYARKLQAVCHKCRLIYLTFNYSDKVNKFLLSLGCFSCVPKSYKDDIFFHALWLLLNDCPYIPYSFLIDSEDNSVLQKDNQKCFFPDGSSLTKRQIAVLRCLAEGLTNKEIAEILDIAEATVKLHINRLLKKLYAKNRSEAVKVGIQLGFLRPPKQLTGIKVHGFMRKRLSLAKL